MVTVDKSQFHALTRIRVFTFYLLRLDEIKIAIPKLNKLATRPAPIRIADTARSPITRESYAHPKTTTSHSCPMRAKRCQRGCNRKSGHSETLAGTRQSGLKFSMSGYCPTEPFRWNRSP
jgi:hypothetical protein